METGVVATTGRGEVQVQDPVALQAHAVENLLLLQTHCGGVHAGGLLHRGQRQELEQVVLDDVARGADGVVVAGPGADADVLGHGDLDMVHVALVPQRLEHRIGEPQRQDVLHRLLAQVVIHSEDIIGTHDPTHQGVELTGTGAVVPEGLLDDDPPPGVGRLLDKSRAGDPLGDGREPARWDRQVEGAVPPGAPGGVEVVHDPGEPLVGGVVLEGTELNEAHPCCQLLPDRGTPRGAGTGPSRLLHVLAQVVVGPGASADPYQGEAGGEQATVGQVVDGGQKLVASEITGDAEHHQDAGVSDTR